MLEPGEAVASANAWAYDRAEMRLNHITLDVGDVELSADFYKRLGLTQIVANYPRYARLSSPEGDVTLSLQQLEQRPGKGGASLHFEVGDVDRVVGELENRGFTFTRPAADQPYLWREAVLLDPDGYEVFIYHAGVNRLNPPWRLPAEGQHEAWAEPRGADRG